MKRLNGRRMKLFAVGIVAGVVFASGRVEADFTWARKTDMPIKKMQHSTSIVGGKIYSIGGWYAVEEWNPQWEALKRVDEYDPMTDTWTRKADMPTGRGHTNACVVAGKICVIGGDAGEAGLDPIDASIQAVEVYDPVTDTWTRKADMPTKRCWFSTCLADGLIYVIGGTDGETYTSTVEVYNPLTDAWTQKADMFTGRAFLATCVVDGLIYAIGGGPRGNVAVEAYDPATDTWTTKAPMPTARYGLDAVLVDGKIYAIGGWWFSIGGPIYSTVEVYDPVTDGWTMGLDIPVTTAMFSTSAVNGKIYVMGGATATHDKDHWILTSAVYASEPLSDLNGDGIVDAADMCTIVDHWGEDYALCDVGPMPFGDGVVSVEDLVVLSEQLFEEVNDPTLIAHWPLDEAPGDIAYNNVSDLDGTLVNGPVWQPDGGIVDGALQFDGVDDYVETDPVLNPADGVFSVIGWIEGGNPGQVVLSQGLGSNWLMLDSEGRLMTELKCPGRGAGTSFLLSQAAIDDGNWHRIGFVWDGSYRHLHVDGVEVAADVEPLTGDLQASGGGIHFGAGSTLEAGTFFSGLIDEVRIYNRVVRP